MKASFSLLFSSLASSAFAQASGTTQNTFNVLFEVEKNVAFATRQGPLGVLQVVNLQTVAISSQNANQKCSAFRDATGEQKIVDFGTASVPLSNSGQQVLVAAVRCDAVNANTAPPASQAPSSQAPPSTVLVQLLNDRTESSATYNMPIDTTRIRVASAFRGLGDFVDSGRIIQNLPDNSVTCRLFNRAVQAGQTITGTDSANLQYNGQSTPANHAYISCRRG